MILATFAKASRREKSTTQQLNTGDIVLACEYALVCVPKELGKSHPILDR